MNRLAIEGTACENGRVVVATGDITSLEVDAIVNAANSTLMGGGGVDGAIHRAGGDEVLEACKAIRRDRYPDGLPTGKAVITTAGALPARFVIHTVGPVWHGGTADEDELLARAYRSSLELAAENNLDEIAFSGHLNRRLWISENQGCSGSPPDHFGFRTDARNATDHLPGILLSVGREPLSAERSMSLNWREIDLVLDELPLQDAHIQQIVQPDFRNIFFQIYQPGKPVLVADLP